MTEQELKKYNFYNEWADFTQSNAMHKKLSVLATYKNNCFYVEIFDNMQKLGGCKKTLTTNNFNKVKSFIKSNIENKPQYLYNKKGIWN